MPFVIMISGIAGAIALSILGLLCFVGAVNGRAEEEYWAKFWLDTPSTDAPRFEVVCDSPPQTWLSDMEKAA